MSKEYKLDEEIHALSDEYGYIAKVYENTEQNKLNIEDVEKFVRKYCEYLIEFDKERAIKYLLDKLMVQARCMRTDENFQIIFRPPWIFDDMTQRATLSLKFTRSEKDNLT